MKAVLFLRLAMARSLTRPLAFGLGVFCLILLGCDSPQRTIDQLRQEIADYPASPTPAADSKISQGFAELDAEIARLQNKGRSSDAATLQGMRNELQGQYEAARVSATIRKTTDTVKQLGDTFRQAGEEIGDIFKGVSPTPSPTE